jgi:hypothetical protein
VVVKCWGNNAFGELGDGTTTDSAVPVGVVGLGSGVLSASAGGFHSCAVTAAGALTCWGHNPNGELGDGTTTDCAAPVDVMGLASAAVAVSTAGITPMQGPGLERSGAVAITAAEDWALGAITNSAVPIGVVGLG